MRSSPPLRFTLACLLTLSSGIRLTAQTSSQPIPLAELGQRITAEAKSDTLGITPTKDGAELRCSIQKLAGRVTSEGLWMVSTEEAPGREFRIKAMAVGRQRMQLLDPAGRVTASDKLVQLIRSGVIEEYSVSADGVRQDFVIAKRPEGTGELRLSLSLHGARAEAAEPGARLILDGTNREIAYSRL